MKKALAKSVLSLALLIVGMFAAACAPEATSQDLAGQEHPRHETGLESQVADY